MVFNQLSKFRWLTTIITFQLLSLSSIINITSAIKINEKAITIGLNTEEVIPVNRNENVVLLIENNHYKERNLITLFNQIFIEINGETVTTTKGGATSSNFNFPFHSIRGISTDDGHTNLENIFKKTIRMNQQEISDTLQQANSNLISSSSSSNILNLFDYRNFIRDIFSSCPSPLFGNNIHHSCTLTFSPFGSLASITIKPKTKDDTLQLKIKTSYGFNIKLVVSLVAGIVLMLFSPFLAKSKVFQYLSGAALFVCVGGLIAALYISGAIANKKQVVRSTGVLSLMTSTYGATVVWFLRTYLQTILINFWEICLIYTVLMAVLGLFFVKFVRAGEYTKHYTRVTVKWILRFVAVLCLFHSTASPAVAMTYIVSLFVLYILHWLQKSVVTKVFKQ